MTCPRRRSPEETGVQGSVEACSAEANGKGEARRAELLWHNGAFLENLK